MYRNMGLGRLPVIIQQNSLKAYSLPEQFVCKKYNRNDNSENLLFT